MQAGGCKKARRCVGGLAKNRGPTLFLRGAGLGLLAAALLLAAAWLRRLARLAGHRVGLSRFGRPSRLLSARLVMNGALAKANNRVVAFKSSSLASRVGNLPSVPPHDGIWHASNGEGIVP